MANNFKFNPQVVLDSYANTLRMAQEDKAREQQAQQFSAQMELQKMQADRLFEQEKRRTLMAEKQVGIAEAAQRLNTEEFKAKYEDRYNVADFPGYVQSLAKGVAGGDGKFSFNDAGLIDNLLRANAYGESLRMKAEEQEAASILDNLVVPTASQVTSAGKPLLPSGVTAEGERYTPKYPWGHAKDSYYTDVDKGIGMIDFLENVGLGTVPGIPGVVPMTRGMKSNRFQDLVSKAVSQQGQSEEYAGGGIQTAPEYTSQDVAAWFGKNGQIDRWMNAVRIARQGKMSAGQLANFSRELYGTATRLSAMARDYPEIMRDSRYNTIVSYGAALEEDRQKPFLLESMKEKASERKITAEEEKEFIKALLGQDVPYQEAVQMVRGARR